LLKQRQQTLEKAREAKEAKTPREKVLPRLTKPNRSQSMFKKCVQPSKSRRGS
jgi:hypothetical protein